jgi:hypothetical protein
MWTGSQHEFSLYSPTVTSEPEREDLTDDVIEKVIVVGGSHSSRLTDELDDTCLDVTDISVRGWRLTEAAVEEKVRVLKELVASADEKRTTVVYQLYDNVSYMVKKADGTRSLPAKGRDGRYHVEGRLEIAKREEIKKIGQHFHSTPAGWRPLSESGSDADWTLQVQPLLQHHRAC